MKINILGSEWAIETRTKEQDSYLKDLSGYCDPSIKLIVIQAVEDYDRDFAVKDLTQTCKQTKRHEIIHAYLYESGLWNNSNKTDAWALNEEMIDWLAIQWHKIQRSFEQAGCTQDALPKDKSIDNTPDEYTAEDGDE